jgi:hypothetical protein
VILNLFDGDAQLEQVRRQSLATANLLRIRKAIQDYRLDRRPDVLTRHTALAVAVGVGFLLFWIFAARVVRFLLRAIERRYKHRIREVGIQSLKLLPAERMWLSLVGVLKFAATAVAAYMALDYILSLFPWTRELSEGLSGFVLNPLHDSQQVCRLDTESHFDFDPRSHHLLPFEVHSPGFLVNRERYDHDWRL